MHQSIPPTHTNIELDPNTCEVMEGHQHEATDIDSLADSICALGQINPIQVIKTPDGRNLIVSGRRRWMACKSRNFPVRADVWESAEDDIQVELFARAIRIAENTERRDPGAMDVSRQLRTIRNEHGFKNAREVASHLGMTESKVKHYMRLFRLDESLQKIISDDSLNLSVAIELGACQRHLGIAKAKNIASRVRKEGLSSLDVARFHKGSSAKKTAKPRKKKTVRSHGESFLKAIASGEDVDREFLEDVIERLQGLLPPIGEAA